MGFSLPRTQNSLHLLRALLRECTYLPDPAARTAVSQHVLTRFREYDPVRVARRRNHLNRCDPSPRRQKKVLTDARRGLSILMRANLGEARALRRVLLFTYGRVGKPRRVLMAQLTQPDIPVDDEAVRDMRFARPGSKSDASASISTSASTSASPSPRTTPSKKPRKRKHTRPSPRPSPQPSPRTSPSLWSRLWAVIQSQLRQRPPAVVKRELKRATPVLPAQNLWKRPLPKKREQNLRRKFYREMLDRVLPPLPEPAWDRLRRLATGAQPWTGPVPRRRRAAEADQAAVSYLDADFLRYPIDRQRFRLNDGGASVHRITARSMRRLWTQVLALCPVVRGRGSELNDGNDHAAAVSRAGRWQVEWATKPHNRQDLAPADPGQIETFFDVRTILQLVEALAEYEESAAANQATEAGLLATLSFAPFDASPLPSSGYARTLLVFAPPSDGAEAEAAVGMALYFYNYSTWRAAPGIYIEDLFVLPEQRGRGYGRRLLAELAREVRAVRGARLEWSVLKWNTPSIKF
ncbi:MAG: hypothetical protein M1826_004625 [Phylliscum demangeonii]|nr:MAG: hypothetical protein M1826_004625 [Phylliscum demangeonii]